MFATVPYVSVDEYLSTDYSPDCDYVEGVIEERNLGTRPHSGLQNALLFLLTQYQLTGNVMVYPEQRVQTTPKRFRVPDICVTEDDSDEFILRVPPLLCVEILSPEDRMPRVQIRLSEYIQLGVRFVWLIDPITHEAWTFSEEGLRPVTDGVLRTFNPDMEISLEKAFQMSERRKHNPQS